MWRRENYEILRDCGKVAINENTKPQHTLLFSLFFFFHALVPSVFIGFTLWFLILGSLFFSFCPSFDKSGMSWMACRLCRIWDWQGGFRNERVKSILREIWGIVAFFYAKMWKMRSWGVWRVYSNEIKVDGGGGKVGKVGPWECMDTRRWIYLGVGSSSWRWHWYKTEVLFWRGLIVFEISVDPKQAMLHFSYFTWSRNIHPLLYVYLVPD